MSWSAVAVLISVAVSQTTPADEAADAGPAGAGAVTPGSPDAGVPLRPIEDLDLEALLELPTVSSAKVEQRAAQAAAVVTVVTAEELRSRGYTCIADALRVVPGFYDVYDQVTHNVGVRGINGGARASGNVLKLMIDGHPVDFRPTTGNFFGEELIPLEAVERLEIIRGPASALYGANAFLGVVNVITRKGAAIDGARLTGRFALTQGHPGGGGEAVVGAAAGPVDVLLAADLAWTDRSGLALPASSPSGASLASRGPSQGDFARARSLYGKVAVDRVLGGRLTLSASLQALDARAEFHDFAPLTHATREGWVNQNYRLLWEFEPSDAVAITASAHYLDAAPSPEERIDLGRPDYVLLRQVHASGFGVAAEARVKAVSWLTLTGGADLVVERHQRQSFAQLLIADVLSSSGTVVRSAGTIIPGPGSTAPQDLINVGGFVQAVAKLGESFSATVGGRLDEHTIYHGNLSGRAGLVFAPPDWPLSIKALFGSSFKAPSAVQLYTQPMGVRDVLGNPSLQAQTARTFELAGLYGLPKGLGEIPLDLFFLDMSGRVEFLQQGLYLQAQNVLDERVLGAELESRFNVTEWLKVRVSGGVARTVGQTQRTSLGVDAPLNPLFPVVQAHVIGELKVPWVPGLAVTVELSLIGPRASSQSNALILGHPYELPSYVYSAAAVSWAGTPFFGRPTSVALRATNLFNVAWADPGVGGIDLPSRGIGAMLTLSQGL